MSDEERAAFFAHIHRSIREAVGRAAASLGSGGPDLIYPPNSALTDDERAALGTLGATPALRSAFEKVAADATAAVLFDLFALLDGVGDPAGFEGEWLGFRLARRAEADEEYEPMLHDELFESYWSSPTLSSDPLS